MRFSEALDQVSDGQFRRLPETGDSATFACIGSALTVTKRTNLGGRDELVDPGTPKTGQRLVFHGYDPEDGLAYFFELPVSAARALKRVAKDVESPDDQVWYLKRLGTTRWEAKAVRELTTAEMERIAGFDEVDLLEVFGWEDRRTVKPETDEAAADGDVPF